MEADNKASEKHATSVFRIQVSLKSLNMDVSCPPTILETTSKTILLSQPRKPPSECYSYLGDTNTASTVFWYTNLKELKIIENQKGGTVHTLVSST